MNATLEWMLECGDPWVRYRTLIDLLHYPEFAPEVQASRKEMLTHPEIQSLLAEVADWPGYALKRHNDANHPLHKLATLADFGLKADDPGIDIGIDAILSHQSPEGSFQSLVNIPSAFGGCSEDQWTWILCDAPILLYALIAMGLGSDQRVVLAADHLESIVSNNGWRCICSPDLGKFRGPGRKEDPCPIANVYALRALSLLPDRLDGQAVQKGVEMLLWQWEIQKQRKIYLFGIGTDFRKLKYPLVWYDILHVVEVLSRFPFVLHDPRFGEMLEQITCRADEVGRYQATSMYKAWQRWEFADKKSPSPWITFLVTRILQRATRTA